MNARPLNEARVYVRRSTSKQGTGIHSQLEWAVVEAKRLGLTMDASPCDLDHMLAHKLIAYKHIYLDDGITGADLERPGFSAFRRDVLADRRVSHVLIHMADRFARPDLATRAVQLEQELLYRGVTVVFSNRIGLPRRKGERNVGEDLQMMFAYSESGEYLDKLAVRMIQTQSNLARRGHWTGGRPPYGFVRVRVMSDRTEQEMPHGTSIRQPGSHTELRVKDPTKIKVWVMALHWCQEKNWGCKRIAKELNLLGIPSPDAERTRTERGRRHRVSGRWTASTVRALLRNTAIIGELRYGVQSEGAHRRLGLDGSPRLLEDHDELDGRPKVVFNPPDLVIRSVMPNVAPLIDVKVFDAAQRVLDERGKHQRGIAKIRDASKYPLSTRVFDMDCGSPMYGRKSGERLCYTCGRYINTDGAQCEHNQVDAEATLGYVLGVLRQKLALWGGRDALRERLMQMAKSELERTNEPSGETQVLTDRLREAEAEQQMLARNLGYATDAAEFEAIRPLLRQKAAEVEALRRQLGQSAGEAQVPRGGNQDAEVEVDKAMAMLEHIQAVVSGEASREHLRPMFTWMNLNVWLRFTAGLKGRRQVRVLAGGTLTARDAKLPCRPYGADAVDDDGDRRSAGGATGGALLPGDGVNEAPSARVNRAEDVSFSKVHRGDKI